MISIRKAATELERWEELSRAALACYSEAIESTGQYALDLDKAQVEQFRNHLDALRRRLRETPDVDKIRGVQGAFDGQVRDYQHWLGESVERLRRDLAAAAAAVEAFSGSVAETGTDLEKDVKRELQQLNRVAASDDLQEIRSGVRLAAAKIAGSLEQMQSRNQLAIAQLKDEIRLLHQQIDASKRAQPAQPAEEIGERKQIDSQMQELIRQGRMFSVLLVMIRNLEGLRNCHPDDAIETALATFADRFASILPGALTTSRWSKDQFAAVLDRAPASTMALTRQVTHEMSKPMLVGRGSAAGRALIFDTRAGVVEFLPGSDAARFQSRLQQLATALAS